MNCYLIQYVLAPIKRSGYVLIPVYGFWCVCVTGSACWKCSYCWDSAAIVCVGVVSLNAAIAWCFIAVTSTPFCSDYTCLCDVAASVAWRGQSDASLCRPVWIKNKQIVHQVAANRRLNEYGANEHESSTIWKHSEALRHSEWIMIKPIRYKSNVNEYIG